MRRNKYLDELGIPRDSYMGNFVRERKWIRWIERKKYGFDYSDTFNMKISFAEWLYCHLVHFEKWNKSDLEIHSIEFEGKNYTIGEAVTLIKEITADYLKLTEDIHDALDFDEEDRLDDTLQFATRLWSVVMVYLWL